MNEISANISSKNNNMRSSEAVNEIRRGRSRILSLYKSQNISNQPERRRSFLKVFSKENKNKQPIDNTNGLTFKTKVKDRAMYKIMNEKLNQSYLMKDDRDLSDDINIQKKKHQSKSIEKQVFPQRITLQPRRGARKNILRRNMNAASRQMTKDTSHSDFVTQLSTISCKNTQTTKLSFIKNETPVNYLTMLEEEDPRENQDTAGNPFLNY